ncbi:GNAT family N-acetyltransferase [Paenibacillus sp. Z6-24]
MINNLMLIEPSSQYKNEYLDMVTEWKSSGEKLIPWVLRFDNENFQIMIEELNHLRTDKNLEENKVNSSTFWLANQDRRLLGVVNIRHRLNHNLLHIGGHIGYGIRPSERQKGYATEMLRLALLEAKKLGMSRILVTCDKDNIGSAKTIINNGGILDSEEFVNDIEIQRYWIEIKN